LHNNMITIGGKKMGKSYNNVIKLTEMFSGDHPLLSQAFSPMTVRFFILQTQYRSTLDFSSEALVAAEKGLKRLWEGYEVLKTLSMNNEQLRTDNVDKELNDKIVKLIAELDDFMNDDFNTAKVLANLFELVPIINGIKDGHISAQAISENTFHLIKNSFKLWMEDILGLKNSKENNQVLNSVMELLIDIRKEARTNKDFATSDKIRNQLSKMGIILKDEKTGNISWDIN
ncbi:MAG: DALR domain-containing protein, partial [Chitinophagaceae bacterium]